MEEHNKNINRREFLKIVGISARYDNGCRDSL